MYFWVFNQEEATLRYRQGCNYNGKNLGYPESTVNRTKKACSIGDSDTQYHSIGVWYLVDIHSESRKEGFHARLNLAEQGRHSIKNSQFFNYMLIPATIQNTYGVFSS